LVAAEVGLNQLNHISEIDEDTVKTIAFSITGIFTQP
jgi:hypothetical protein